MPSAEPAAGFLSVGQPIARAIALNAARRGRIGQTLLVQGSPGAGKGAFVDDLLALLFCSADRDARPCNRCRGCADGRARRHPDLVIGSPDRWRELRSTGESVVAAARRWLAEAAGSPIVAERRVVLVEGVDRAGDQVQNALLKALEEPSDRQVFVLVADDPGRLLPTIRSRAQPLRIGPVARTELVAFLQQQTGVPGERAEAAARLGGGLTGRALALAADADALARRSRLRAELLGLLRLGRAERLERTRELLDQALRLARGAERSTAGAGDPAMEGGDDHGDGPRVPASDQRLAATEIAEAWLELARDLAVSAADPAASAELGPELRSAAEAIGPAAAARMVRLLQRVQEGLEQNAAPRLSLDVAVLAWPTLPAEPAEPAEPAGPASRSTRR
jgi:DNA polymerase III delta prime subunit